MHKTRDRQKELITFLKNSGLKIKNLDLLNQALTHGSYLKDNKKRGEGADNERLEFFGDAILKIYVSEYLMQKYCKYTEGQLSSIRAYVVSEKVLTKVAQIINIENVLRIGKSERKNIPPSILADSVEALLATIYYDVGAKSAKDFVFKYWADFIDLADKDEQKENYKAVLQEFTQANKLGLPLYKTIYEGGPDHKKVFEVAVCLKQENVSSGRGSTKKEASQNAAKAALAILKGK